MLSETARYDLPNSKQMCSFALGYRRAEFCLRMGNDLLQTCHIYTERAKATDDFFIKAIVIGLLGV